MVLFIEEAKCEKGESKGQQGSCHTCCLRTHNRFGQLWIGASSRQWRRVGQDTNDQVGARVIGLPKPKIYLQLS